MNKSKSSISLVAFVAILFAIGFAPYLTQNAFADIPNIDTFVADDPDNGDLIYSNGDTFTLTFNVAINVTASATMSESAIDGNFTLSGGTDFGTDYTGLWDGTRTTLTITVSDITGAVDPIIDTTTIAALPGSNLGHAGDPDTSIILTGTPTLSGDYGLVIAVTTSTKNGGGNDCNGDCFHPTLGVSDSGKRIVDNGFSYNGNSINVERYFTPYPLVTVDVGKQNVAEFKIYDNRGPDNVRHFELAFGLDAGQILGISKAVIIWDKTWDGIESLDIIDPENVLEKITVTTSEGKCSDTSEQKCLIVKVVHTFRAPLDFNIFGTLVWDDNRNGWQNYFNHGIEVVGESLNPPKEYDGINKGHIYHLTETGKTSAVDEFGNSWSLEYGLWNMDYIPIKKVDEITMHGYDRNNSNFNLYKYYHYLLAENKLDEICPNCRDEPYDKINNVFAYEYPEIIDSFDNSEIQLKMIFESERAQKIMDGLLDPILHLKQ